MENRAFCPQCGLLTSNGRCLYCERAGTVPSYTAPVQRKSSTLKYLLIAGGAFLLFFIAVAAGFSYMVAKLAGHRSMAGSYSRDEYVPPPDGPVARPDELKGTGTIYLVQLGDHKAPYSIEDLAQGLRAKYSLDVQVLPAMAIDKSAWQPERRQYIAQLLNDQIKHAHPDLAANPNAYLIGFTDVDTFSATATWQYVFTQRDMERAAIISSDEGMKRYRRDLFKMEEGKAKDRLQARLRRILLWDVAVLYWHLPLNNNPHSLMYKNLNPGIAANDIYESDLRPEQMNWGRYEWEPCLFFSYSATEGIKPQPGELVRDCSDHAIPRNDESLELFQVNLRQGLLFDRHTDFSLPDTLPIHFRRTTRDGYTGSNPFGISGSDNYDDLLSSRDNVRIAVVYNDGERENLIREPVWLPFLSLVKYVDTDYSGKYDEMRWHTAPFEHYELKRYDGLVRTYLPCSSSQLPCCLDGIRDAEGQELKFDRDSSRRLVQLTSPNKSWLKLSYGAGPNIVQANDSRGRIVHYGYDAGNRLISVAYSTGEVFHYEYDSAQRLLSFSVSTDGKSAPQVMLRNEYENGRLTKQTFARGGVYTYRYADAKDAAPQHVTVQDAAGRIYQISINSGGSAIREFDKDAGTEGNLAFPN
jgi:hypothetical protein